MEREWCEWRHPFFPRRHPFFPRLVSVLWKSAHCIFYLLQYDMTYITG